MDERLRRPVVETVDDRGAPGEALPVDLHGLGVLLADVLEAEGAPPTAHATLFVVSAERMAELNAEHLGGVGPTDVLSFPLDGVDAGGPGGGIVGDVVICPQVAITQAPDHAGDPASELSLLVTHGGLHLCGWDHADPAERERMWARERELLEQFGRSPSRDPWTEP